MKELKKGEGVGYGLSYRAVANTKLAILPVGYWDGYDRKLSNQAEVIIAGKKCPVRGRVCMNLTMVEFPSTLRIKIGDEVILLGSSQKQHVSAEQLAALIGTINYEIPTRINPQLPRRLVK